MSCRAEREVSLSAKQQLCQEDRNDKNLRNARLFRAISSLLVMKKTMDDKLWQVGHAGLRQFPNGSGV